MKILLTLKTFFKQIGLSFYSKKFYKEVLTKHKGAKLLFLLGLSFVISLPIAIKMNIQFNSYPTENIINQLPTITVTNYEITSDLTEVKIIYDNKNQPIAMIDTVGKYTNVDEAIKDTKINAHSTDFIIALKQRAYFFEKNKASRTFEYTEVEGKILTQTFAREIIELLKNYGVPIFTFIFSPIILFIISLFLIFITAILSYVITAIKGIKIDFAQRMRATVIASIPTIIVYNILLKSLFEINTPTWLSFGTTLVYFWFIIESIEKKNTKKKK